MRAGCFENTGTALKIKELAINLWIYENDNIRQNLAIYDGLFPHFATRVGKRG